MFFLGGGRRVLQKKVLEIRKVGKIFAVQKISWISEKRDLTEII